MCIGKLRANKDGDKYVLYDNGENLDKVNEMPLDKIRVEHGAFFFRYEPCNVGNIRKMIIMLPALDSEPYRIGPEGPDNTLPLGQD